MSEPKITITEDSPKPISILDGMQNLSSGLGTSKDITSHNFWEHSNRNADHVTWSVRYREDWLSQKVVNIIPEDMCRDWRTFDSDDAQEADLEFEVARLFQEAYKWARLYGTSFIILDIADGRNPDKPLNWNKLSAGCLRSAHVVDRTRVVASAMVDQNPMSLTYGMPEFYQYVGMDTKIHKSRLIRFEGTELPTYERLRNLWYSDSILIPLTQLFDSFHSVERASTNMAEEASVDVVSVEGLSEILQNSKGTAALQQRFLDWKQIKGTMGVSILDTQEVYEQKKIQLNGITDLTWKKLEIVAASVGIPATRFLCNSPSGLGNSGHSDVVNYAESLIAKQKSIFDPRLRMLDKLISAHFGLPDEAMKYTWNCVFPESNGEKAERQNTIATSLGILADSGVISRESALKEAIDAGIVSKGATVGDDPNAQTMNTSANGATSKSTAKPKSSTGGK